MSAVPRILSVMLVVAIGAGVWFEAGRPSRQSQAISAEVMSPDSQSSSLPAELNLPKERVAAKTSILAADARRDYPAQLRKSRDYRKFIDSILGAANGGDRDAQYYLSAALAYCDETNRFFFKRGSRTLSVDEAITDRERFPGPSMTSAIRRAAERCHDVNDASDAKWETADEWLARAAAAGQPVAEIHAAEKALLAIATTGSTSVGNPVTPGASLTVSDARTLVRRALESNDPEVIFEMGSVLGLLQPRQLDAPDTAQETITWEYAACLRGMDCAADADWHVGVCLSDPNCRPDESGVEYLQRSARQLNVSDLNARAAALNARLNAQDWNGLGIGG